jgi:hypothetical protein
MACYRSRRNAGDRMPEGYVLVEPYVLHEGVYKGGDWEWIAGLPGKPSPTALFLFPGFWRCDGADDYRWRTRLNQHSGP